MYIPFYCNGIIGVIGGQTDGMSEVGVLKTDIHVD